MKYPIRVNVKMSNYYDNINKASDRSSNATPPTRVPESSSYIIDITTAMSRLYVHHVVISDRLHNLI